MQNLLLSSLEESLILATLRSYITLHCLSPVTDLQQKKGLWNAVAQQQALKIVSGS